MEIKKEQFDRKVRENFEWPFDVSEDGLYLIEIIASCKNWLQNWKHLFNDDDLAVKIDDIEFPKLNGKRGLLNGEAAWNGNNLKGLKKTGIFILYLKKGKHKIYFTANKTPFLGSVRVVKANNIIKYSLEKNRQAQDGNNRQWISIALVDLPLKELKILAKAEKRDKDRDDVKLIVDGQIQKNTELEKFKNWYWCGSLDDGEEKIFKKEFNLQKGLHYIEFWADRMPTLNKIQLILKTEDKQDEQQRLLGKVALYKDISSMDCVNFRSDPVRSTENIIAEIKTGESVEIIEKEIKREYVENLSNIWHKVRWNGKEGYILSSFIEISGQERDTVIKRIKEKAAEMELDQKLMLAIAFQESKFKPFAVSYTYVKGLFQITEDALKDVEEETGYMVSDRFDFEQSIEAGFRYYKYVVLPCFDKNDKQYLEKTIAAYNAGYNKIPQGKNVKLIYKNLELDEIKKNEVEKYTKSILKNYKDKGWFRKLLVPILLIFAILPLIYLNKVSYANNKLKSGIVKGQHIIIQEEDKKIVELYNIENNIYKSGLLDESFKLNLGESKIGIVAVKETEQIVNNRNEEKIQIFFNDKELINSYDGLKEVLLWNPHDIMIARFWGGQSIYNYFFDLRDGGAIIPFISDGKTYDFAGSAGGSWFGEMPVFGEVFIMYYRSYGDHCSNLGEVFKLYGDSDGWKLLKIWDMEQSGDWCDNFHG